MADPLKTYVIPYINFFIFLGLAIYFMKKPLANAAKAKREKYDKLLSEAQAAKEAAQEQLRLLKERHQKLDAEVAELKKIAKESAETEAKGIVDSANRLSDHLKAEAHRIAEVEVENARQAIRDQILAEVKANVTAKMGSELGPKEHKNLVKSRIDQLSDMRVEG